MDHRSITARLSLAGRARLRPRLTLTLLLALAAILASPVSPSIAAGISGKGRHGSHAKHKRPKHKGATKKAPAGAQAGVNLMNLEPSAIKQAAALGVHWVRVFARWEDLEPAPGQYAANWFSAYERLLAARPKGMKVIVDFVGAPSWETGSSNQSAPPRDPVEYATILNYIAKKWAGKVAAFEIWNEEDSSLWWGGATPEPVAYTNLLKLAYTAVKTADPKTEVVLGGLVGNDYPFLEQVYDAGGKGYFNAIGVHTDTACDNLSPYIYNRESDNRMGPDSFMAYKEVHATELAHGDDVPIWMTEMSWRTTSAICSEGAFAGKTPEGVSEATQAKYLTQAYNCLAQAPYVKLGLWFPLSDQPGTASGLLQADGSHKPSWSAMQAYIEHGNRLHEPCGDFSGPKITVKAPKSDTRYSKVLGITVSASDPQGVDRIHFEVNGHEVVNFDNPVQHPKVLSGHLSWVGARKLSYGRHVLVITATDFIHNNTVIRVPFIHVPPPPKKGR